MFTNNRFAALDDEQVKFKKDRTGRCKPKEFSASIRDTEDEPLDEDFDWEGIQDKEEKRTCEWSDLEALGFQKEAQQSEHSSIRGTDDGLLYEEFSQKNIKTLDQYLAEKKKPELPSLQPRQLIEDDEWKNMMAFEKHEENYFVGKKEVPCFKNKPKKKNIYLRFSKAFCSSDNSQTLRSSNRQEKVDVFDNNVFPAL